MPTLGNKKSVKEKIKREINKYLDTNKNGNVTHQNLWDAAKTVLKGRSQQ